MSARKPPERCQPRLPWKSLRPPGRSRRKMCSRSGAEAEAAPSVAGSNGPREAASRAIANTPLRISKRRSSMSSCGTRSHARCRGGPRASAAARECVSAPSAAPVATCRETITTARSTSSVSMRSRDRQLPVFGAGLEGRRRRADLERRQREPRAAPRPAQRGPCGADRGALRESPRTESLSGNDRFGRRLGGSRRLGAWRSYPAPRGGTAFAALSALRRSAGSRPRTSSPEGAKRSRLRCRLADAA
jgi:hypothetical protein